MSCFDIVYDFWFADGLAVIRRADHSAARARFAATALATAVLVFLLAVIAGGLT